MENSIYVWDATTKKWVHLSLDDKDELKRRNIDIHPDAKIITGKYHSPFISDNVVIHAGATVNYGEIIDDHSIVSKEGITKSKQL
jgi:hypothetical protein